MKRAIRVGVVSLLGLLSACHIKEWDDECDEDDVSFPHPGPSDDADDDDNDPPPPPPPPPASKGGSSGADSSDGGSSSSGGSTGGTGGSSPKPPEPPPPTLCGEESDCPAGFNCSFDTHECAPTDQETCGELRSEQSCTNRVDCTPVYAGTGCSCGQDCECRGGEPGCICESFSFFACEVAPAQ